MLVLCEGWVIDGAVALAMTPFGLFWEMSMLTLSYATAACAMLATALYFFFRLRLYVTTTTMLIASLLLIYGPAFLAYTYSSGEKGFLLRLLSGAAAGQPHPIFSIIRAKISDLDSTIAAMNFCVALMYLSIIAGIETVDRFVPERIVTMRTAMANWNSQSIQNCNDGNPILLAVIMALVLLMMFFSITENQIGTIWHFLSIKDDNALRDAFRLHFAASPNYLYRVILGAVAPMFVIWGLLAGWVSRSWQLLLAASLLFIAVMIGKADTLSKAPPAFFLIQLVIAGLLTFTNRINWRSVVFGACIIGIVLYAVTRFVMIFPQGTEISGVVYFRVFEATNQALLENFATFPSVVPHLWGADIRPIALLMGLHYLPGYSIVAHTWYGTYDVTSPALFIADAWADFSYLGVVVFSAIAGAVCRLVDALFLTGGKTVTAVAVLGATFFGIFTLLITALNTALLSGGLLLAPLLAGLVVVAMRYFGPRKPAPPVGHATS